VLEACRAQPVQHLVYASSSSVYGANSKVPYHEDDPVVAPVSLYAATKRANELMAQTYAHLYGVACSGVRFFTVYGPWGRPDMAIFKFTRNIIEGSPIDVYGFGNMTRDLSLGFSASVDEPRSIASSSQDSVPPDVATFRSLRSTASAGLLCRESKNSFGPSGPHVTWNCEVQVKPGDLATEKPYMVSNRKDRNVKCVGVEKPKPVCATD